MEWKDAFALINSFSLHTMKAQNIITIPAIAALMLAGGAIAGYTGIVAAQSGTGSMANERSERGPHVGGEITAINGSALTVSDKRSGTSYTVETSGATIMKDGASAELSSFAVGDRVMAEGTINGTTVTATKVFGGIKGSFGGHGGRGKGHGVMGEVTAVNGSTITVTGMDGTSYTVNADGASVKRIAAGALSDIAVGDRIGVHGEVSGTNVTATTIMDDVPEKPEQQ